MNIAIGSAFRNSAHGVALYFERVARLKAALPDDNIRVIAVEGDSIDHTPEALILASTLAEVELDLVKCDHHGPVFGSVDTPERMAALSCVGNAIFDNVKDSDDVLVYVESDLLWDAQTIATLVRNVANSDYAAIAPLIFAGPQVFYDIWGFRKNGVRFSPFAPYHPDLKAGLNEVDSVGSCLVVQGHVARTARIRNNNCLVGWCEDVRTLGYIIAVDTRYEVKHPC